MKETINYNESLLDMRSLFYEYGVKLSEDEKEKLVNSLEAYLMSEEQDYLTLDLKEFYLVIKGWDEAGNLLSAIN